MLYIGNHTSSSRGYLAMGKQMLANGGNTFAFFTRNPRGRKAKDIDPQDVQAFGQLAENRFLWFVLLLIVNHYSYVRFPFKSISKRSKESQFYKSLARAFCQPTGHNQTYSRIGSLLSGETF